MPNYKVTIGEEFAVDGIEIEEIDTVERLAVIDERRTMARDQARITYGTLGLVTAALTIAALMGWSDGSYDEIDAVWQHSNFFVGLVLGRYFKRE